MAIGLQFRETMAGNFSLGATDPKDGAQQGKAAHEKLAMHARVAIEDLQAFVDDPNHPGGLTGSIDFPPLGIGLQADSGVFNLFSPAEQPELKLMVYELGFSAGGEEYYLAGKKHVRDDPGFDLWSDTTTLYSYLHRGNSSNGPVVGAGILKLGVDDLASLLSTVEVSGTDSTAEKASAVGLFGKMFLGELWGTYASRIRLNSGGSSR